MKRIRLIASSKLARYPKLKAWLRTMRIHWHFNVWRLSVKIRSRRWAKNLDIHKIYWVDPSKIEYACILKGYDKFGDRGKVVGGHWDQKRTKLTEFQVFQAFEDRFVHKKSWQETYFYQRILNEISSGKVKWGCKNKAELDKRFKYLDNLYQDIKVNGYKSQQEIQQKHNNPYKNEDEISVHIGRDGALLFEDGRHRLAIAKLIGIDKIPIKVSFRHLEWFQFRNEILDYAKTHKGKVYHPITHIDLCDIPAVYDDKRFQLIKEYLPVQSGDLLDIGAHWGYFCHKFEAEGFNCFAVENDISHLYFLERLKKAENRKFQIINQSVFDYYDKIDFDVVLALNIFHHFLKEKEKYQGLIELLNRLHMKVMFFQAHLPNTPQMKGAYRNYDCDEFVNFILENSNLTEAVYIGETPDKRPIYKLD